LMSATAQPPAPPSATGIAAREPSGLSSLEAARRLAELGTNAMPQERTSLWRSLAGKLWAPIPWMLEAAILLQLVLGEHVEAAVIALLVVFNAALGVVQEGRARETLEALKSRLALTATVRRDGVWRTLPASEIVPGDLIKLSLGGIVAADARILSGEVLLDQSTLTGESLPIEAGAGRAAYAGSLVRRGEALAEVTATGVRTHATVLRVVRNLAIFDGAVVVAQVAYGAWLHLPTTELIPLTLTAILAAIPVALPATFTLASALGARALARKGVLPTRLSSVEEAATLDVLCVDKTGTLTQN
jgi:H+-transporting ATPase